MLGQFNRVWSPTDVFYVSGDRLVDVYSAHFVLRSANRVHYYL